MPQPAHEGLCGPEVGALPHGKPQSVAAIDPMFQESRIERKARLLREEKAAADAASPGTGYRSLENLQAELEEDRKAQAELALDVDLYDATVVKENVAMQQRETIAVGHITPRHTTRYSDLA